MKQAALNTAVGVLQTEVKDLAGQRFQIPNRQTLGHLQGQPQYQPALADFGRAAEDMYPLGQQPFYHKCGLPYRELLKAPAGGR